MTWTATHSSKVQRGQRFVLGANGRKVYTAYNTPKHADARGNYSVTVGAHSQAITFPADDTTVYVVG